MANTSTSSPHVKYSGDSLTQANLRKQNKLLEGGDSLEQKRRRYSVGLYQYTKTLWDEFRREDVARKSSQSSSSTVDSNDSSRDARSDPSPFDNIPSQPTVASPAALASPSFQAGAIPALH